MSPEEACDRSLTPTVNVFLMAVASVGSCVWASSATEGGKHGVAMSMSEWNSKGTSPVLGVSVVVVSSYFANPHISPLSSLFQLYSSLYVRLQL